MSNSIYNDKIFSLRPFHPRPLARLKFFLRVVPVLDQGHRSVEIVDVSGRGRRGRDGRCDAAVDECGEQSNYDGNAKGDGDDSSLLRKRRITRRRNYSPASVFLYERLCSAHAPRRFVVAAAGERDGSNGVLEPLNGAEKKEENGTHRGVH